ncbi:MAG: choloylglycine hydrolase family protein [Chlamydiales bacterium]|nr:choloylglycine hydrolase family protein [Chlamydiales bacterium]
MFRRLQAIALAASACALSFSTYSEGCTDFIINAEDKTQVVGRSLEFGQVLPTTVIVVPKGKSFQSTAPNNKQGMKWSSKYAYASLNIFDGKIPMDGLNEKGLSVGALWFPDGKYADVSKAAPNTVVAYTDLVSWLLGNFSTVAEVKTALSKVNLYTFPLPEMGGAIAPLHLAIHDASGKSLVVEFVDGETKIHDNDVGVLTNSPDFPWHRTNLRNFINLSAIGAKAVSIDGTVLQPTGQGSGLLGIPGDWTPPSRFVRTAIFKQSLQQSKTGSDLVTAAFHMLNTVDIPYGAVRGSQTSDFDYTQWVVVKDLTNFKLYVRTYGDQNIQTVDLSTAKEPRTIALGPTAPSR